MQTAETTAIPVIEIDGKDYSLTKLPNQYVFSDSENEPIVIAEPAGHESWFLRTLSDSRGHLRKEGDAWVLYEGPIRTRHVFTFGLDNSMIKAAEVIIRKEIRQ